MIIADGAESFTDSRVPSEQWNSTLSEQRCMGKTQGK